MIAALTLAEIVVTRSTDCKWPGCPLEEKAHGYCDKHRQRVQRGWEPGCETAWERLVAASLALSDAESDKAYDLAAERLKRAAEVYRRARRARRAAARRTS